MGSSCDVIVPENGEAGTTPRGLLKESQGDIRLLLSEIKEGRELIESVNSCPVPPSDWIRPLKVSGTSTVGGSQDLMSTVRGFLPISRTNLLTLNHVDVVFFMNFISINKRIVGKRPVYVLKFNYLINHFPILLKGQTIHGYQPLEFFYNLFLLIYKLYDFVFS